MKLITLVSSYLLFITFIAAQTTPSCDTIVLKTGEILSVSIDMVSHGEIYYRDCPVDSLVQHKVGLTLVEKTYGDQAMSHSLISQLSAELEMNKYEMNPFKKWVFKRKAKKMMRSLSERQRVKVKYRESGGRTGTTTIKGVFVNMTNDDFIMETRSAETLKIKKENIFKISLYKPKGDTEKNKFLGGFAIISGVTVVGFVVGAVLFIGLLWAVLFAPFGIQPDNDGDKVIGGGCLIGTLLIGGGIALLLASVVPKGINDPFGGDWEITNNFQQSDTNNEDGIKRDAP